MATSTIVTFKEVPVSAEVEAACLHEAEKLERFCDKVIHCRVTVSKAPRKHQSADSRVFHVRLTLPGDEIAVEHSADPGGTNGVRDVFAIAGRKLEDYVRRRRGSVKAHAGPERGRVRALRDDGFGFVETGDGRSFHFRRETIGAKAFEELEVGAEVDFMPHASGEGSWATGIRRVGSRAAD